MLVEGSVKNQIPKAFTLFLGHLKFFFSAKSLTSVLAAGHANNFLVQNVSWALVEKLVLKFAVTTLQDIVGYDIYKTFEDLFLSENERNNMILDGIQSEDLCKIRSGAGDQKTSGVDAEKKN